MTAVDFLHSEYIKIFGGLNPSTAQLYEIAYALEQAKEMEKEQIMNAWNNGFEENRPYVDHSEDYYNETYNKK
jgi:hypothetical protein